MKKIHKDKVKAMLIEAYKKGKEGIYEVEFEYWLKEVLRRDNKIR